MNCGSTLLISHLAPFCDNQQYLLTRRNDSDSKVKLMRCGILHLFEDPKSWGFGLKLHLEIRTHSLSRVSTHSEDAVVNIQVLSTRGVRFFTGTALSDSEGNYYHWSMLCVIDHRWWSHYANWPLVQQFKTAMPAVCSGINFDLCPQ